LGRRRRHQQRLFRQLNDEIRRLADIFAVDEDLELVCECDHGDCFTRIYVRPDAYAAVRRIPARFLVSPDHLAADDRVVETSARYVVVERPIPD
jgi:hypothetical protein